MRGFVDETIDEIVGHLNEQMTSQTKAILVPGGFGKCPRFINRLREVYCPKGMKVLDPTRDL